MDEMNFRNQKISDLGFTRLGCCWHLVGWDREGHSLRKYTFHRYHWFAGNHFPVSCAAGNSAVFCSFIVLSADTGIFWTADPLINILPTRYSKFVVYNGSYTAHFIYYKKKSFSFGLEPAVHRPESYWTHNFIPRNNRFVPDFDQIGRRLGEWRPKKTLWPTIEGDHA